MKHRPRLFHLFNAFEVGGVERQHMRLIRRLAPRFEQVCWSYCPGPIQGMLDEMGIPHGMGGFDVLKRMSEEERVDCFVVRTNRYLKQVAPLLSAHPAPVVYTRNYLRWFDGNKTYFDPELEKIGIGMADHVLFSGPSLRNPCLQLGMDIPGGEIIYNGLNLSRFPLRPLKAPGQGVMRVAMLANIAPRKNQLTAIRLLRPELEAGRMELHLGGVVQFPEYGEQVRQEAHGLPVVFHDYVSDVVDFLCGCHVLLMTSTLEGWPNAIMEALACGLPAVVPDVVDIAELMGPSEPGAVYPDGEYHRVPGLLGRLRDDDVYDKLSRRAVARARELDVDKSAALLEQTIRSVLR